MAYPLLLHGKHLGDQVTYQPFGSWIVPWQFHTDANEYDALRAATGLIDFSTLGGLTVAGADRTTFLQNLLTNDVARLAPGSGCRAALVTNTVKLVADFVVLAEEEALQLLCDATRLDDAAKLLAKHHVAEQVTVTNRERSQAVLALQGPRAIESLIQITGRVISLPGTGDHSQSWFENIPVRLVRYSLIGEVGVLCLVAAEQAETAWAFLLERGRAHGLRPVGYEALNTARIECGYPWYGHDMDETNLLPETGLDADAVSDRKGCYLGQEIIARMATQGSPSKKLMGLSVEGMTVPEEGDPILKGSTEVGRVTSACMSPRLGRPLALGYLKRGAYEAGTAVQILRGKTVLTAAVAALPFIPRR